MPTSEGLRPLESVNAISQYKSTVYKNAFQWDAYCPLIDRISVSRRIPRMPPREQPRSPPREQPRTPPLEQPCTPPREQNDKQV